MRVYEDIQCVDPSLHGGALSIGNFDGVHLGHQRILQRAVERAAESGGRVVAVTFEPHPVAILRPDAAPPRLTPWPEKARLLERAGADAVVCLRSDAGLLSMSAESFVRDLVVSGMRPRWIVEGPDFGFGRGRRGGISLLRDLSSEGGYRLDVVEPCRVVGQDGIERTVSSSAVRAALVEGAVDLAADYLGRPYRLFGAVVRGAGQGRILGFPTINLAVADQLIPAEGVYAGAAEIDGRPLPAAISVGRRPTFDGQGLVVEAFILDAGADWYERPAALEFRRRLRDQIRFDGPSALAEQIARDVAAVRALGEADATTGERV